MVQLAVDEFFGRNSSLPIKVDDIEILNGNSIPTYFLIKKLEEKYPEVDFHFVMGADLLPSLHLWDEGEKFKKECRFVLTHRQGYSCDAVDQAEFPLGI